MEIEFEFRGKITEEFQSNFFKRKMITGSILYCPDDIVSVMYDDEGEYDVLTNTVTQYTNLKDKNNVKIFGKDIVKYAYDWDFINGKKEFKTGKKANIYYGIVDWEIGEYSHYVVNPKRMSLCTGQMLVEVIGNVFENQELIEKFKLL